MLKAYYEKIKEKFFLCSRSLHHLPLVLMTSGRPVVYGRDLRSSRLRGCAGLKTLSTVGSCRGVHTYTYIGMAKNTWMGKKKKKKQEGMSIILCK